MQGRNSFRAGLARLFGGRRGPQPLDPDRPDLVVVAACFDDAEACSATLERAGDAWRPEEAALLRHHLRLPAAAVGLAAGIAAQDGYRLVRTESAEDPVEVRFERIQVLDALHCSQERSRMVGLAQRHDGTVLGWDALQPGRAG